MAGTGVDATWTFAATMVEWRGPAPYSFLRVPPEVAADIAELAPLVTYGWGVIPASVRVGTTTWRTSLFPREGSYLIPVKLTVRVASGLELGDTVQVELTLGGVDA